MERLTDDRFLKDGFYQPHSKDEEKEIRSMGNDLTFEKLYKHCAKVEKKNAELQKQVDELQAKANEVNDLVKEKVKAIFTRLAKRRHQGFDGGGFFVEYHLRLEDLNWIEAYCGVEVE